MIFIGKQKLTREDYNYIIKNYNYKTSTELAKEIKCSRSEILKVWMDNKLKGKEASRQYYCNFHYFKNIDSSDKAYLIGLLAADGCIYKRAGHQGLWQLQLQKKDKNILEKISKKINSNKPLQEKYNNLTLSINSDIMYNDLINIGLFDKKTYTLISSNLAIPYIYWMDYIRGYFDGDGCINIKKSKTNKNITPACYYLSIVGFKQNIKSLQNILESYNIESQLRKDNRKYNGEFYSLNLTNIKNKYLFIKYIYSNINKESLFLERKYIKAMYFIYLVENNITNRSENKQAIEYFKKQFKR